MGRSAVRQWKAIRAWVAIAALAALLVAAVPAPAAVGAPVAAPPGIVVQDGVTQPVFSYAGAIRERIYVESPVDSDGEPGPDLIATDIIRPRESDEGLSVPSIIVASPYYSIGRGRENQRKDTNDPPEFFPLVYDNYFVPRGYAVVLPSIAGTHASTGCPDVGGPAEVQGIKAVIDWLNGRARAFRADGTEVFAHWSNGKAGMIGKSWDGSVANGVAATGVDGLKTIVPIAAISSWYEYFWHNGVALASSVPYLFSYVLGRSGGACDAMRDDLQARWNAGGAYDPSFYDERNYRLDARNVKASVFIVAGLNDYNVKPSQYMEWWDALARHGVPRKIWLSQVAHEEPFDFRRAEWIATLHRWFDYWLHGIDNGIMDEPIADVELAPGEWHQFEDWPDPRARQVALKLAYGDGERPATLTHGPVPGLGEYTYTETRTSGANMVSNPFTPRSHRLAFLSPELKEDIRISGRIPIELRVALDRPDATFTAYLVDYGRATRVNHASSGGLVNLDTTSCWGEGTAADTGCFRDTALRLHTNDYEIVARGWFRAKFHKSLEQPEPLEPGEFTWLRWEIMATDYVFRAGHRIGVVIGGSDSGYTANPGTQGTNVTVKLGQSRVWLPVVGGVPAIKAAFGPDDGLTSTVPPHVAGFGEPVIENDDHPTMLQILDRSEFYPWPVDDPTLD